MENSERQDMKGFSVSISRLMLRASIFMKYSCLLVYKFFLFHFLYSRTLMGCRMVRDRGISKILKTSHTRRRDKFLTRFPYFFAEGVQIEPLLIGYHKIQKMRNYTRVAIFKIAFLQIMIKKINMSLIRKMEYSIFNIMEYRKVQKIIQ